MMLAAVALDQVGEGSFEATPQPVPWPKAYGGDIVAAALAASDRSVAPERAVHSIHGYFLRAATIGEPVRYDVEVLRDGRAYGTREVRGHQDGKLIFVMLASYHVREQGEELRLDAPDVTAPEELPTSAEYLSGVAGPAAAYWSHDRSFDMRHVEHPLYLRVDGERVAHQALWLKAFERLPDDPATHRVALAYACDYTILEPVLRGLGLAWSAEGLVTASLDHAMWFHRDGRADEWLLYAQKTQSAQDGRGLARGHFFTADGRHLATVLQEGMIRRTAR